MSQIYNAKSRAMLSIHLKNGDDGDKDRQYESSRTYSNHPLLARGCEQFAVRAKTYSPNEFLRRPNDQDAVQQ